MQHSTGIRGLLTQSMRENAMPLGLVTLYVLVAIGLAHHFDFGLRMKPWFNLLLFATCYMLIAVPRLLWLLARERPESPIRFLARLPGRWRLKERLILAAPMLLGMAVFFPVFSSMKSAIPAMSNYELDPLFARMDVMIHGRHAWEVLQPVLGYPLISYLLNGVYHLWLPAFYMTVAAAAVLVEQPELRRRFFIAFILCWALLGNLAATLLASVGPCFYAFFYPGDPYAGLMSYLHQADTVFPLAALDVQATLIGWWREGTPGLGRGISAMPSVHVAIACLIMLLSWRMGRVWAAAGTIFLVAIVLGSIHLAYHYAVDAYFSLVATPLIWWVAGRLAAPGGAKLRDPAGEAAYRPAE